MGTTVELNPTPSGQGAIPNDLTACREMIQRQANYVEQLERELDAVRRELDRLRHPERTESRPQTSEREVTAERELLRAIWRQVGRPTQPATTADNHPTLFALVTRRLRSSTRHA